MALTRARLWSRIVSRPAAQACSVVRVEKFLSDSDIATVLQLRDSHAIAHGPAVEVRSGWKTTYLNADGLFCARAPDLHGEEEAREHRAHDGRVPRAERAVPARESDRHRHGRRSETSGRAWERDARSLRREERAARAQAAVLARQEAQVAARARD